MCLEPIRVKHLVVAELGGLGHLGFEHIAHKILRAFAGDNYFTASIGANVKLGSLRLESEPRISNLERCPTACLADGLQYIHLGIVELDGIAAQLLGSFVVRGRLFRHKFNIGH